MKILMLACLCFASRLLMAQADMGKELFEHHCGACHREKGAGTIMLERRLGEQKAILEDRLNLTEPYIRAVVRKGLGTMERLGQDELTDPQLALISNYLSVKNANTNL